MQGKLDPSQFEDKEQGRLSGESSGKRNLMIAAAAGACLLVVITAAATFGQKEKPVAGAAAESPTAESSAAEEFEVSLDDSEQGTGDEEMTALPKEIAPWILKGDRVRTFGGESVSLREGKSTDSMIIKTAGPGEILTVLYIYDDGWALLDDGKECGFAPLSSFESAESEDYLAAVESLQEDLLGTDSLEFRISRSGDGCTLTVSGEGRMRDYGETKEDEEHYWYYYSASDEPISPWAEENITRLVIEEGVTSIGDNTFACCDRLTEVELPDSLTEIGNNAFRKCGSLKEISFPAHLQVIGEHAFEDSSLEEVFLPDEVLLVGEGAFASDYNLISFAAGKDNSRYAVIDEVLYDKVRKELVMFPREKKAEAFAVPNGIRRIGDNAFGGNRSLKSVTFPDTLRALGRYSFFSCDVTEISLNNNLAILEYGAFSNCTKLSGENLLLPDRIKHIGYCAFYRCGWDQISIPPATAVIENRAFDPALTSLFIVDPGNRFFYAEDGALFRSEEKELFLYNGGAGKTEYSVPEGTTGLANGTFLGSKSLQTIYIPASVTSISPGAFGWSGY